LPGNSISLPVCEVHETYPTRLPGRHGRQCIALGACRLAYVDAVRAGFLRYRDETMPRYDVAHFGFAPLGAHGM
jgi:hypothetical protein